MIHTSTPEDGIKEILNFIKNNGSARLIIGIAGGSASGKTSKIAGAIKNYLGSEGTLISMDDYYRGLAYMKVEEERGIRLNWDHPDMVDKELLKKHLLDIKYGRSILKPIYNFKTGENAGYETITPGRVAKLEGLFALSSDLIDIYDFRVFVEIGMHGRLIRRLLRDIERTNDRPADILRYFSEIVEPMHEKFVETTKKYADLVILNEFQPRIESEKSGIYEMQVKFPAQPDADRFRYLGAERLGVIFQIDHYYNPKDRNLRESGEMLRVREEGAVAILTYKGPTITGSGLRKRPKFEFEIDPRTRDGLISIYAQDALAIRKKRTLYRFQDLIFSFDEVEKEAMGCWSKIGCFIEIRVTDHISKDELDRFVKALDLDTSKVITESYYEM